ncbi:MAG: cytochrome B6 [Actinobacteria bacterium]|nr:cytochrome B6 [Actinomycetota bacterium]
MADKQARNHVVILPPAEVKRYALRFTYTLGLGGISVGLAGVLAVTGILLMFGYRPALATAFVDTHALAAGGYSSFLRSLHRWSAYLLIISVFLHMVRVFYHGAYRGVRRTNWVIGVLLLAVVAAMAVSGNILPWDQRAMAVGAVVETITRSVPLIGGALKSALFGPTPDAMLLRAYVFHVVLLPFVFLVLAAVHLWKVRRDGLSGPV